MVLYLDQINFGKKFYAIITGKKIVYSKYARVNNFGDKFNLDLVRFFNAELIYVSSALKSQMVLTGSILGDYPRDFSGNILGAGFIADRYNRIDNSWKIDILRGPLSAKQCGAGKEVVYGDPGILASKIFPVNKEKVFEIGIIPHSRDLQLVNSLRWGNNVRIISPRQSPSNVAEEMKQCKCIASSSLHGLIFADSFRIPNIHLKFSDHVIGGFHKFDDYYLGMQAKPEHLLYSSILRIEDIVARCRLRYTEKFLNQRQEEIKKIIYSVIHKEDKVSSVPD